MAAPIEVRINAQASHEAELARILSLPRYGEATQEFADEMSRLLVLPDAYQAGVRLRRAQAWAIAAYSHFGGRLFCPIGVGEGKTLTTICMASAAKVMGYSRVMLVVPAQTLSQIYDQQLPLARRWVRIHTDFWFPGKMGAGKKATALAMRQGGCYVVSYSALSGRDGKELLEAIEPEAFIFDEVHGLAGRKSTRTSRIFHYAVSRNTPCTGLSGTVANRSLMDYHHIAKLCLDPMHSFMPVQSDICGEWDTVIGSERNAQNNPPSPSIVQLLMGYCRWANAHYRLDPPVPETVDGIRRGYRLRMMTAPAVIYSRGDEVDCSIYIEPRRAKKEQSRELKQMIAGVDAGLSPDGVQIPHALGKYAYYWELAAGVYYSHHWPDHMPEELKVLGDDYLIKRNEYAKALREYLKSPGYKKFDSPMLVGQAFHSGRKDQIGDEFLYQLWTIQREAEMKIRPWVRIRKGHTVCDAGVQEVLDAVRHRPYPKEGVIVWYAHREYGRWLAEKLYDQYGDRVEWFRSGNVFDAKILNPANRDKIMVCSLSAHGTGKNLQFMGQAIFAQLPKTARDWNQALGRIHRTGQTRDEVFQSLVLTNEWSEANLWALLMDAAYLNATTSNRQKALIASWTGPARAFPDSYLFERGWETSRLTEQEKASLRQQFDPQPLLSQK